MTKESQRRAVDNQRKRMRARGYERYEVIGPGHDKELVRKIVQKLAANDADAQKLREQISPELSARPKSGADIYRALRASPLVGTDLDFSREFTTGRDVDL